MRTISKTVALTVCLVLVLVPCAIAQFDRCEGNFDYDDDVDGTDAFTFKTDFGRSLLKNPCPLEGPAPVPRTGQTLCYEGANIIECAGTGQDGELEMGIEWPGTRFSEVDDLFVEDNLTGLMWLKNANVLGPPFDWFEALEIINGINSSGILVYNDWRIPNARELFSLIDFANKNPALPSVHPFEDVQADYYWSSTSSVNSTLAWTVDMNAGSVFHYSKAIDCYVWPVRESH